MNLKPCPFCGSTKDVEFHESVYNGNYAYPPEIGCLKCGYKITGMTIGISGDNGVNSKKFTDNLLINWWNRRVNDNEKDNDQRR